MNKKVLCENLIKIANEFDKNGENEIADEITKVAESLSNNIKEAWKPFMGWGGRKFWKPLTQSIGGAASTLVKQMTDPKNKDQKQKELYESYEQKIYALSYDQNKLQKIKNEIQTDQNLSVENKSKLQGILNMYPGYIS